MVSSTARGGRRRRVLNEEVRTSSSHLALSAYGSDFADDGVANRYGQQAHIENHPQVTDFIPRRKRRVALLIAAGVGGAAVCQALAYFSVSVAAALPGVASDQLILLSQGVTAWTSAIVLLSLSIVARLILSLRRHRVDDVRGRYRIWKWAAAAAMLLSVNSVLHVDALITSAASAAGWSFTSTGVEWALIPAVIVGGWIVVGATIDLAESRTALAAMTSALACYAVGVGSAVLPAGDSHAVWAATAIGGAPLVGHTFLLAAALLYARYVVLDVQGLIEHRPSHASAIGDRRAAGRSAAADQALVASDAESYVDSGRSPADDARTGHEESSRWIDGSEGVHSDGDDDNQDDRKLSKSQRKKLRKQKASQRAA